MGSLTLDEIEFILAKGFAAGQDIKSRTQVVRANERLLELESCRSDSGYVIILGEDPLGRQVALDQQVQEYDRAGKVKYATCSWGPMKINAFAWRKGESA